MSLTNLSLLPFVLGLLALAGLLFLLQRLRVRYREVEVVTTLFWKQAVEETRARVLVRRFRHPLAYLLALAIAALVWLAFAEPRWGRDEEGDYVLLLDGSAGMQRTDRFAAAVADLEKEAARLPASRRRVFFCGTDARLVLDRGEEAYLLGPRLKGLAPEMCPSSLEKALFALSAREKESPLRVLLFGDAPVAQETLDVLPGNTKVTRVRPEGPPVEEKNAGVAGVGVSEAASGAYDRVDIMLTFVGDEAPPVVVRLGNRVLQEPLTDEGGIFFLRDVPAAGEVLEVTLAAGDAFAADDSARVTLPLRKTVPVLLEETVDERLRMVVDADPALTATSSPAEAGVALAVSPQGALPALEMTDGNAITIAYEESLAPSEVERLYARFAGAGLDRVGRKLEEGADTAFRLDLRLQQSTRRGVQMGTDLLGNDYDFVQSSAFPVFVSDALRWLAGVEPVRPFAVAGERLPGAPEPLTLAEAGYAPPRAGDYAIDTGETIAVSLAAASSPGGDAVPVVAGLSQAGRWPGLVTLCVLLALVLVGGEWWLFQKGRIP